MVLSSLHDQHSPPPEPWLRSRLLTKPDQRFYLLVQKINFRNSIILTHRWLPSKGARPSWHVWPNNWYPQRRMARNRKYKERLSLHRSRVATLVTDSEPLNEHTLYVISLSLLGSIVSPSRSYCLYMFGLIPRNCNKDIQGRGVDNIPTTNISG